MRAVIKQVSKLRCSMISSFEINYVADRSMSILDMRGVRYRMTSNIAHVISDIAHAISDMTHALVTPFPF